MFARLMGLLTISPTELHRLMAGDVPTIGDVDSNQSSMQAHVPGAVQLDPVAYAGSDLPPGKASVLVSYCSDPLCRKAPNTARRARKLGFAKAIVMSVGITGWLAAKLPTESGRWVRGLHRRTRWPAEDWG